MDLDQLANSQSTADQQNLSISNISPSNSISLIRLDELSSFGATKQNRLPALIKMNDIEQPEVARQTISMPAYDANQLEAVGHPELERRRASLSAELEQAKLVDKENLDTQMSVEAGETSGGFEVVDEDETSRAAPLLGPSLPPSRDYAKMALQSSNFQLNNQQPVSQLGDSLIDMIINLKNENQKLLKALETNNEFVKQRIEEFKAASEESKRREAKFALEKVEHEHQLRKVKRQNDVLSERLKNMELKLKDLKLEVGDSLTAAHSSAASSERDLNAEASRLYPELIDYLGPLASTSALGGNAAAAEAQTIQMDATSGELYNQTQAPSAPPMEIESLQANRVLVNRDGESSSDSGSESGSDSDEEDDHNDHEATRVGQMSREELSKRFDADKAAFYALDDPMKQCDKLEQQLNDIGKRDYEICLLQQQLNIYRQDYRLEKMANLEAKIQIEKLKTDIEKLCLERLQEKIAIREGKHHSRERKSSGGFKFAPAADMVGRLGNRLSKKAVRSAAKAAKYAAKQARLEERASAAMAAAASYNLDRQKAAEHRAGSSQQETEHNQDQGNHHKRHHHHHHRHHRGHRSEVVSDLLSTANKAMMTSYKMASTHVNLALDKLNQFEQAQASKLAENNANQAKKDLHQPSLD